MDIAQSIEDTQDFVRGYGFDDFKRDKKTVYAVVRAMEVIGEAAKNIPEPIRSKYPNIPWRDMAGMRDKLIHAYFGVDVEVLWKTIQQDIPLLKVMISEMLAERE
jgi:uncharacterized protein with HEPN domain